MIVAKPISRSTRFEGLVAIAGAPHANAFC
jgi:hypothetical protein